MSDSELSERGRWLAFAVLCLGDIMIVLDSTIVNVALPSIRTSLGFNESSLVWVVNAYLLTFGGFLLLGGRLADLYGQRRLFIGGIVLFTLASLACGLAPNQGMLIIARAAQGLGGAIVAAVALSLMMVLFPEGRSRVRAMALFGFVMAAGGSVGVLLSGVITGLLDWRWVFLINIPIGVAVVALSMRLLPKARSEAADRRLDIAGAVTVTAALLLAVYGIVGAELGRLDLSAYAGDDRRRPSPADRLHRHRGQGPDAPDAVVAVQAAQRRHRQCRGRAVGGGDVCLVLPFRPLHAAGARLRAA
jgi:MFS family permease